MELRKINESKSTPKAPNTLKHKLISQSILDPMRIKTPEILLPATYGIE